MRLERADVGDAGEILTLQRAAWVSQAQIYNNPHLPPMTQTLDELATDIEKMIVHKAVEGHRIVGSVRMRVRNDTGLIGRLMVAPDMQGRGLGKRLMEHIEADAPESVTRFELFTGEKSASNITFYEALDYREFRRTAKVDGVELVFFEKDR